MKRKKTVTLLLSLLIVITLNTNLVPQEQHDKLLIKVFCNRVVDGDTISVLTDDKRELRIRYIGIDTPETKRKDVFGTRSIAKKATEFNKKLVEGKKVYLEYDYETNDRYKRELCYVWLDENRTKMAQYELLRVGLAVVKTYYPNLKYYREYLTYSLEAENH